MNIYIVRGEDTIGPYNPGEAAELVREGYLSPDDYAARDGDASWKPLSTFLPATVAGAPPPERMAMPPYRRLADVSRTPVEHRFRWVAFLLPVLLLLLGGWWLFSRNHTAGKHTVAPAARVAPLPVATAKPTPRPSPPAVEKAAQPSAMFDPGDVVRIVPPRPDTPDSELHGVVSLAQPDGTAEKIADVRVSIYPLDTLTPSLAEKNAQVRAELDRLAPQIAAAQTERAERAAAAQTASDAFLQGDPDDPMISSFSFAAAQAKNRVKAADEDLNYLLGQRKEALDGERYFRDLPPPMAQTETNAAGEYTLVVPSGGTFAVAASVRQSAPEGSRVRYWLLKVSLEDGGRKPLPLNDGDVASTGRPDSLIHAE